MKDRIFLDANVLFSAAYLTGSKLGRLWESGADVVSSAYAIAEARKNIAEVKKGAEEGERLERLERLLARTKVAADDLELAATLTTLEAKDRPILAAAIRAKATHLLTGDRKHFGGLFGKTVRGVTVMPPGEYPGLCGRG